MAGLEQQFLVLHNEQRPTDAPCIRVNPDLTLTNVSDHRDLDKRGTKILKEYPGAMTTGCEHVYLYTEPNDA